MSTNKHAIIRYQALDKCFRNPGRKYFIDDLINACNEAILDFDFNSEGVKRRQIFDDIRFMESEQGFSIPLKHNKDGKKVYYRYSDLKFSISNQPLNETEANQLKETLLVLSRFKGMPQFEWIDEIVIRLESAFKLKGHDIKIIDFDQNPYLKGLEFFSDLFNAILYKRPLAIQYKGYKQANAIDYILHPYYLKQYNNRWFLLGLNDKRQEITNLAIDRIISIRDSKVEFIENNLIDFNEFFEDIVGVTIPTDAKPEKVLIKVSNDLWPYIDSKPLHGSQKIIERSNEGTIIQLEVIVNYELISILLSHAEKLTIYEPSSLVETIKCKAKSLIKNYL